MSSTTLQFVVAGALIAAWTWMLGRPILTNLLRRSRRDSIGHFRYQQAVLSRPAGQEGSTLRSRWADRPRPVSDWRAQPVERRRLQLMLGFAMATFAALLMAIALRGPFVRLFVLTALCFAAYLGVAAYIGARTLRQLEARRRPPVAETARPARAAQSARSARSTRSARSDHGSVGDAVLRAEPERSGDRAGDDLALLADDRFGTGVFEDEFFEPIPELVEPLSLDASLLRPGAGSGDDPEREHGADGDRAAAGSTWVGDPIITDIETSDEVGEPLAAPELSEQATFTSPAQRSRPPKRDKARPIYIESQLDDGDDRARAVND